MNTNLTTKPVRPRTLRSTLRYVWDDQVAAHRAMLELRPYYDRQRQDGR